ncbi:MAG TPA: nuclear transport factor 2 family protein [Sphingomonadaceae bacterium]|nr:nuclear transport factor 2 family protein [Sphingomonadaceae bacterium]
MIEMVLLGAALGSLFPVVQPIAADAIAPAQEVASEDYRAKTERNRAVMRDFVTLLYDKRDPRAAFEKYVHPDYIQHNPGIADGREEALKWLEPVFSRKETEIQVRRVLVDGDFATVQIIGRMGPDDPGSAVMNIFRLENGLIVEHWDVTQAMPAQTASGRPLG